MALLVPGRGDVLPPKLIGRARELNALIEKIDSIGSGGGNAIIVRGDAGIGKSALLHAVAHHAAARDIDVLATTAMQSEVDLPLAALHQLLLPSLGLTDRLPAASRQAIEAAFGQGNAAVNPSLIGFATLQILGERDNGRPLVVLVDDAQWLDPSSANVLAFVARRIESDPILLIAAARSGFEGAILNAAIPEMTLEPLDEPAAAELLEVVAPALSAPFRDRILQDALGNPLALVELPIALRSAGIEDGLPPALLPLTARLTSIFTERYASLSIEARQLLLVVAAHETGTLADILSTADRLTSHASMPEAISEANSVGLIETDGASIRFSHPLIRSAIYEAATLKERQAVHTALADVVLDPDRRAWHFAVGIASVDDDVAQMLESASGRARQRGAIAAALRMMDRAALISRDPSARAKRMLWAGELAYNLGRHREAVQRLRDLDEDHLPAADRPLLAFMRELAETGTWTGISTVSRLVESAERLRNEGAIANAMSLLTNGALRYWWSNPDEAERARIIGVAERMEVPPDDPWLLTVLALTAPVERGAVAVAGLRRIAAKSFSSVLSYNLGIAATGIGDFIVAEQFLDATIASLRDGGGLGWLANALASRAWTAILRGNLRAATQSASESTLLATESGELLWAAVARLAAATVAAYQGAVERAEALIATSEKEFVQIGPNPMLALVQTARGAACLADGRVDTAYEQLRRIYDPYDVAYHPHVRAWALVDLVDAAILANRQAEVVEFVRAQEKVFEQAQWPLLKIHLDVVQAWLGPDDRADELYRTAVEENPNASPLIRARLQLAHGVRLRRQRRFADSRPLLRAASETFDALGALPWAERARGELRASGETVRRPMPSVGWLALSPQELQVAELAAEGLSNKEIARQLFLSHRTVGAHLYSIYPKLGITSRSQLHTALSVRTDASIE